MTAGFMGKSLWVNLSHGDIWAERVDEKLLRDYIGGYGLAAHLYLDCMSPNVDPLGPEYTLGCTTGPLTGTPAQTGTRGR